MDGKIEALERQALKRNHQLIAIIDERGPAGKYIVIGSISQEFEQLSAAELAALKAERGEALLVVSVEKPVSGPGS